MNEKLPSGRRKFLQVATLALLTGLLYKVLGKNNHPSLSAAELLDKQASPTNPRLGLNLSGIADWGSEQPFVDLFKQSREWVSQPANGDWGKGPKLNLDEHGWVKDLSPGCRATRIISALENGEYPSGEYVIIYDGEGDLKSTWDNARIVERKPGRLVISVNSNKGNLTLDLVTTNPQNYMRNIRVIIPGFEKFYQENPWHPEFLKRWSGIACLRMMDFMGTNGSSQIYWQSRPKPADASYASKGVSIEDMVDLANRLDTDVWFCIPHKADNDYVMHFASYVKKNLKPNLHAWFEYSNEVWNGMFEQNQYAAQMGQNLKLSNTSWEAALKYTAYRSNEIFKILDGQFAGQEKRIKKVLAAQVAVPYTSEVIVSFNDAYKSADVLAIAPYVGLGVSTEENSEGLSDKIVADWTLKKLFDYLNAEGIRTKDRILEHKKIANKFSLKLVAYESGQHLIGFNGAENNKKLSELFYAANADTRMGEIYSTSLKTWEKIGGDLNCTYYSMGGWSKWGSWGLLQNNLENPKGSPKFNAVIQWAISRGQRMSI